MIYQSAHMLKNYGLAGATVLFAALMANGPALAGPKISVLPGIATDLNGTVETTANGNADPFVIETFSQGNECLQFLVTFQGADLEATLVAPDGRSWRDDDSAGGLRPRINAVTTKKGWHILRLSHFFGDAVNADFTVRITRNAVSFCNPATPPVNT
ncbi:MAG: hypothetical protein L0Y50_05705 [Beijerinckiaceae bacterium]|nr:hypothetical protein [Beijerinckiaceae bacterium]MCI0735754.1 hypothetical protein [Beijerinckiaceae bacterium]